MLIGPFYWLGKMTEYYTLLELYEADADEFAGLNDYDERKRRNAQRRNA